jgi:hypothetical protein
MPKTCRDIYDDKSQLLHQVGTSCHFHIWCKVTHTSKLVTSFGVSVLKISSGMLCHVDWYVVADTLKSDSAYFLRDKVSKKSDTSRTAWPWRWSTALFQNIINCLPSQHSAVCQKTRIFITTVVRTSYLTGVSPPTYILHTLLNYAAELAFSILCFLFIKLLIDWTWSAVGIFFILYT